MRFVAASVGDDRLKRRRVQSEALMAESEMIIY